MFRFLLNELLTGGFALILMSFNCAALVSPALYPHDKAESRDPKPPLHRRRRFSHTPRNELSCFSALDDKLIYPAGAKLGKHRREEGVEDGDRSELVQTSDDE